MIYSDNFKEAVGFKSQIIQEMCKGKEVWCKVECEVNGKKYETKFGTLTPEDAAEFAKNNFKILNWHQA